MINEDEDALFCDFVETYHVFDYTALPPIVAARLASGLRDDSRIKTKLSGLALPLETSLLAAVLDSVNILVWQNTKDGSKGKNKPKSVLDILNKREEGQKKVVGYTTAEEFEAAWKAATSKARG